MLVSLVRTWRKLVRRLNWYGLFVSLDRAEQPLVILAGYTRSGTTYLGRMLANITGARPIHEPLNPNQVPDVAFFNERESRSLVEGDPRYQQALKGLFTPAFSGSRYTNTGSALVYSQRLIKLVRANHYLDYVSELLPATPMVVISRNPCACISSRLRAGWPVPDHSHSIDDIAPLLSAAQLDAYNKAETVVEQLAVSWCLDNFMLLRNADNPRFHFVNYEHVLLNPTEEFGGILQHIGRSGDLHKLQRELEVESGGGIDSSYLTKWKKNLSPEDVEKVENVLKIFGLDGYYDLDTGLPTGKYPFCRDRLRE